jgi:hypothetical protein
VLAEAFYSAYSLPLFKDAYPEEFKTCGSPSIAFIGNGVFFAYLISNKHKNLDDPLIVRMLNRHKWLQIFERASLVALALALVANFAA